MIRERSLITGEVRKCIHTNINALILMLEGDAAVNYNNIYKWQDASIKSLSLFVWLKMFTILKLILGTYWSFLAWLITLPKVWELIRGIKLATKISFQDFIFYFAYGITKIIVSTCENADFTRDSLFSR